jgi:tetratricopeptide (TPR) repeat protein/predicted Ser/Thr protein kinase
MKCPDPHLIEQFVASDPIKAGNERVRQHIQRCERCRAHATEAAADIHLAERLRCLPESDLADTDDSPHPEAIGGYRILGEIGRGGMAVVYLAEQDNPRRRVALKVIDPGYASTSALRRFEYEVQILGRLQHPGIARIYAAGISDAAGRRQPFFAMELVAGVPLTELVERGDLGIEERVKLLVKLCEALQYAHKKGIIHRDIKPANIYVDAAREPKILDFGVARCTDADVRATTLHTRTGQLIGTVPYMSPEQAGGAAAELDTRSDVYSLAVVAYELLTSKLPYDAADSSLAEAVRIISHEEPVPPGSVDRRLRGDLETILLKALQKHPDRRYQTAADFGADLSRFLRREPIAARRPTALYQIQTRIRKHPVLYTTMFIVALAACVLIGVSWRQNARLAEERRVRLEAFQSSTHAYQLYEAAANAKRRNDRDRAVELLDRAVATDPDFALGFIQRAQLRLPPRYQLRKPESAPAIKAAVEDFVAAHLAAGGDLVRDPATGRILTWEELDGWPADRDEFLKGLSGIRRIRSGRYERIGDDGDAERVGGPGLPRALLEAGYTLLSAGRPQESLPYFERAAAAGVDDVYARIAKAGFYAVSYRREEAIETLGGLTEDPVGRNSEKVWSFLGFVRARQAVAPGESSNPMSDPREAARAFREAIRINPDDPRYHVNLGVALRDFGGNDEALAAYRRAVEIAPDLAGAWTNIGVMLKERGRYREAIDVYRRARDLAPRDMQTYAALASLHLRVGECDRAVAAARELVALQPDQMGALEFLFTVHQECGNDSAAVEVARDMTRQNPDDPIGWMYLGHALVALGQTREAEASFQRCLQWPKARLLGWLGLAAVARDGGRFAVADQWLDQAAAAYPDDPDVHVERAKWFLAQDKPVEARTVLREALDLQLSAPQLWATLGQQLLDLGQPDLALQAFERGRTAFDYDRTNPIEQTSLLLLCEDESLRDPAKALQIIEPLVAQMSNYANTVELYALALLRNSRYHDALDSIDRALSLRGDNPNVLLWKSIAHARSGNLDLANVAYYRARHMIAQNPASAEDVTEILSEAEALLNEQAHATRSE